MPNCLECHDKEDCALYKLGHTHLCLETIEEPVPHREKREKHENKRTSPGKLPSNYLGKEL
jgi:hypothetical protein